MVKETTTGEPMKRRKRKNSIESTYNEKPSLKGRKLKQYVLEEKLDIIDFAKVIGNRAAGREFNVAESSIREWRKNEHRLRTMFETTPERSRLDGGGRRPACEDLEQSLLLYVASTAVAESPLTWQAIKEKACDIWNEICKKDPEFKEKDFAANMGWVARFVRRNNIKVGVPTSVNTAIENGSCQKPSETIKSSDSTETLIPTSSKANDLCSHSGVSNSASKIVSSNSTISSPKRRRKSFTPKKVVEHYSSGEAGCTKELDAISNEKFISCKPSEITVVSMANEEDEDENIDVCF